MKWKGILFIIMCHISLVVSALTDPCQASSYECFRYCQLIVTCRGAVCDAENKCQCYGCYNEGGYSLKN